MHILRTALTLLLLSASFMAQGQAPDDSSTSQAVAGNAIPPEAEYPYRRDIEKLKFDKAADKILRHLSRDSNNLECHYAAYQLYSNAAFSQFSPSKAYDHLCRVRDAYTYADERQVERWSRDSYSGALIDYGIRRVCGLALHIADSLRTPDAYQFFLSYYSLAPADLRMAATRSRDTIEFAFARNAGTLAMMQAFIDRRPGSVLIPAAEAVRDSMVFVDADRQHTVTSYQMFCTSYPQSHLYSRAMDSVYTLDFRDVRFFDAEQYYRSYAQRYPLSPYNSQSIWYADSIEYYRSTTPNRWMSYVEYLDNSNRISWRDTALDHLSRFALLHHHVDAATHAALRFSPEVDDSPLRQSVGHFLRQAYMGTSVNNFARFYQRFPHLLPHQMRDHDSLAVEANANYDYRQIDSCIRAVAPCHEAFIMLQQLLKDHIDHNRFSAAIDIAKQYAPHFRSSTEYLKLLSTLASDMTGGGRSAALSAVINTPKGDEFAPVISADSRTLYFAGKNRPENIGGEDVFVATRNSAGGWSSPSLEMDLSHTYGNEAPISISTDGNTLLLYQTGVLYQADRTANGWRVAKLPQIFNNASWQSDACLAANGRAILFAALGRTDREVDSSLNLYISIMDDRGNWGQPFELGESVNTPFDERSPYLHPDMRTLYFSSEGHGSMGQMDVYVTTRLDDSWTRWSEPINIGRDINTTGDDWGYKVTTDGSKAYFSRREQSQNIYTVTLPDVARPQPVATLSGTLRDQAGRPLSATLCWEDPVSGRLLGQCPSDPVKGTYMLILPLGAEYNLFVRHPDFFPECRRVDLTDFSSAQSQVCDFDLVPIIQMTENGTSVVLQGISYQLSGARYTDNSQAELLRLASYLSRHGYHAVIEVHVDGNVGDADNLILTQQRADGLLEFLVEHGVSRSQLTVIGKGSDVPLTISHKVSSRTVKPQSRRTTLTLTH
ncbi:MAG: OmpA family protein [Bacteroidales bacterium]|nr:OmpA family protein [Bacteroidales bacterium]